MQYIDLILPLPLPQHFTYGVPEELQTQIKIGKRVIVQFGARKYYTGIVVKQHDDKPTDYETKEILSVLDENSVVNELQLQFWQWIAEYYMCTPGEVMRAALPAGLKLESENHVFYNSHFSEYEQLTESERLILDLISNSNELSVNELITKSGKKTVLNTVKNLYDKGAVMLEETLRKGFTAKKETYVKLTEKASKEESLNEMLDSLKRAPKQQELIHNFIRLSGMFGESEIVEVKKSVLLQSSEAASASLNTLIKKGIFEIYAVEISRLEESKGIEIPLSELNNAQTKTLQELKNGYTKNDIQLLYGVTASGKTEIYLHLIKEAIDRGQQVLYLLPEIAITAQIINRLRRHFGNSVGVYHSKFSDNERVEIWNKLATKSTNEYKIIIGVRSSIFLPFSNLGLVIVDEEHENSFKQYDPAPRYHARDAAIVLAKSHKANILLGTATPSVESYYNAKSGKYGLVTLSERFTGVTLPKVHLVNMRVARKKGHVKSLFSDELLTRMEQTLEIGKQVILFQNRRGFSPFIECPDCGWVPKCKHCDVTLTYHKFQNQLVCHYCAYAIRVPHKCGECTNTGLQTVGFGTEKIEEELTLMFPNANIARMDLDSTRSKHAHEEIISAFEQGTIDVLIGTQMVTKGLDFANVGMVGILNADNMLNFPDFRACERSFQLMVQVSGRAGRKDEQGLVVIQTSSPAHPIIRNTLDNDFESMYNEQISERTQFKYPPIFRLIRFTIKHKQSETCAALADDFAMQLHQLLGNRVLGPEIPLITRIQNNYLRNLSVKLERNAPISQIKLKMNEIITTLLNKYKSAQISADVDPV